jgi:uncharacterized tellurite resistance protein B-like protein
MILPSQSAPCPLFPAVTRLVERFRAWLAGDSSDVPLDHAVAALFVHAATLNGPMLPARRRRIEDLLQRYITIEGRTVAALIDGAARDDRRAADLHRFIRVINRHFSHDRRLTVFAMVAQIIVAGPVGDEEKGLLRLLGGLLGISDHDRGVIQHARQLRADAGAASQRSDL